MIYKYILFIIAIGVLGRATLLEYTDLIDPTEARYAVVAQEMLNSGNWLTPVLPMPEGITPYLGKPPLHFWLTAVSYKIFGVEEWSARLPSLLTTIGIIAAIWIFSFKLFGPKKGLISALIYLTSGMAFFLAGASVTDVTLTFLITVSIISLYFSLEESGSARLWGLNAAVFAALSFLTKGPVSLVLIWSPIFLFSVAKRDFYWIKKFPWIRSIVVFAVIAAPWFVWSEIENPGFIKYFFWNENIARYLFKEYGDRYGSGHVHSYGTSWLMLILAFCPWTFVLIGVLWQKGRVEFSKTFKNDTRLLFVLCWAISAPLFFTFVRQLHAMYLLPAIPPVSILTAALLSPNSQISIGITKNLLTRYFWFLFLGIGAILIAIGTVLNFTFTSLFISVTIIMVVILSIKKFNFSLDQFQSITKFSLTLIGLYLVGIGSLTPYINMHRSSEEILKKIAAGDDCSASDGIHQVGTNSKNAFSHYWVASAWENELAEQLKISYVPVDKIESSNDVCHFIVKAKSTNDVPVEIKRKFSFVEKFGDWLVFAKPNAILR